LGIPESAFVFVVVGMRLHNVVDDVFLDLLETIIEEPNTHVVFAGHFNSYDRTVGGRDRLKGRCTFAGFQDDIMAAYEICDAFINPKQPGGGSAIVYAMAAGLPALSLPYGDAGLAVNQLPEIRNYQEMARIAKRLCTDRIFYDNYKAMTADVAQELSSRTPLVNKIMDAFSAYQDGTLRSQVTRNM
jgi:glycosyltransferase involved in cell wall biosynthesis